MLSKSVVDFVKEDLELNKIDIDLSNLKKEEHGGKKIDISFGEDASLIGLVVDYLTRYYLKDNKEEAFKISLMGARRKGFLNEAEKLLSCIGELNPNSIKNAYKLVQYDVYVRTNNNSPYNDKDINEEYIPYVISMVNNANKYFDKYKDCIFKHVGKSEDNGMVKGDCDIIIGEKIYDIKTGKEIKKDDIVQLLVYYYLFKDINELNTIVIYSPRYDISYELEINSKIEKKLEYLEEMVGY